VREQILTLKIISTALTHFNLTTPGYVTESHVIRAKAYQTLQNFTSALQT